MGAVDPLEDEPVGVSTQKYTIRSGLPHCLHDIPELAVSGGC